MIEIKCDVAIIGGGPAGLSAANAAKRAGAQRVIIIERDMILGGILQQCIHPGFGLTYFNEELTGPEYSARFIDQSVDSGVEVLLDTIVLEIVDEKTLICSNNKKGMLSIHAKSVVLAMGCRERTRPQIRIPGSRPAGVYTAGAAQRLINRQNQMVGRNVVILGSGDIGMIMARRMTLEGANVLAVVELMDYLTGLNRNKVQCLEDFSIPLHLSHTITRIVGNKRVEGVFVAEVDENKQIKPETERFIECDTVLLSVGLIPENELTRLAGIDIDPITGGPVVNQYQQTSVESIFACGNVVHVNDLVDNVSLESEVAGRYAALYALEQLPESSEAITCKPGASIRYICPQKIDLNSDSEKTTLYFRVASPQQNVRVVVRSGDDEILSRRAVRLNPGEMERVAVDPKYLSSGKSITVSIEERI